MVMASEGRAYRALSEQRNADFILTGQVAVTIANVGYPLPDVTILHGFEATIIAAPSNTGTIFLGGSKVDVESVTTRFDGLVAGLAVSKRVKNLNAIWVSGDNAGDYVSWIAEQ
jgi:hypothetical protein